MGKKLKIAGITIAAAAAAGAALAWVVRDQVTRHRRDLFSPHALQRLAALSHMSRGAATVGDVLLLRDFIAWESRPLLRKRATALLERMEHEVEVAELASSRAG